MLHLHAEVQRGRYWSVATLQNEAVNRSSRHTSVTSPKISNLLHHVFIRCSGFGRAQWAMGRRCRIRRCPCGRRGGRVCLAISSRVATSFVAGILDAPCDWLRALGVAGSLYFRQLGRTEVPTIGSPHHPTARRAYDGARQNTCDVLISLAVPKLIYNQDLHYHDVLQKQPASPVPDSLGCCDANTCPLPAAQHCLDPLG